MQCKLYMKDCKTFHHCLFLFLCVLSWVKIYWRMRNEEWRMMDEMNLSKILTFTTGTRQDQEEKKGRAGHRFSGQRFGHWNSGFYFRTLLWSFCNANHKTESYYFRNQTELINLQVVRTQTSSEIVFHPNNKLELFT